MGCCNSALDEKRILLLGPKNSGKNEILHQLQNEKKNQTIQQFQTKDFNSQSLEYGGYTIYSWDMNGVEKSHPILRHYFNDAKGIIFVVDATTDEELEKVKEEIHHILAINELENCPVLIFANKNDSNETLTLDQIKKKIDMATVPQKKQNIIESNANTGDGIDSGMKWLLSSAKD